MTEVSGTMSFRDHLAELRKRLFRATVAVVAGFFVAWSYHIELYAILSAPVREALANNNLFAIKALQITESIEVYMKISLFGGLILASPFVFYQLWAFVAPGLLAKEKRLVGPVVAGSVGCFMMGVTFCHLVVLPFMTDFLVKLTVEAPGLTLEPTLASTVSFSVMMLLAFGAVFELPLFMYVLAALGLVTARGFLGFYRYWVVISFIIGAILTPTPDPINQGLMSAPLIVLYGVGVGIAWLTQREPGKGVARRAVLAVSTVLVVLGVVAVGYVLRNRDPGPLDGVPADVQQLLSVHTAGLSGLRQQATTGTDAAKGLAPLGLLDVLAIKPTEPTVLLARFADGVVVLVRVADARAVVQRLARKRQASVVITPSGPSVWFTVPGAPAWRAVAAGPHLLWLGSDGGLAHLSAVRQGRSPALTGDKAVAQRLDALRSAGPVWSFLNTRAGIAGWLPGGALVDTVRLAAGVLDRDKSELVLKFECKGPEAAIALRDRIEAWVADSRRGTPALADKQVRDLAALAQELAELVARTAEASARVAQADGPDHRTLLASSARAARLARELGDLGGQTETDATPSSSGALAAAVQSPGVSTATVNATAVQWTLHGDLPGLLDVLAAPATTGLAPDAVRGLRATAEKPPGDTSSLPVAPPPMLAPGMVAPSLPRVIPPQLMAPVRPRRELPPTLARP